MRSNFIKVILCLIVIFALVWLYTLMPFENETVEYLKDVTLQINNVFNKLDINNDGYLDIGEFSSLKKYYRLFLKNQEEEISNSEFQVFPDLPSKLGEQIIYIQTDFKPLDLNSLKKNIINIPVNELGSLLGLLEWKVPYKLGHPFGSKSFSFFLPENSDREIGSPWWIIKPKLDQYSPPLSSERHFPPVLEKKLQSLFALLSLFHPRPFLWTRFAPQGTAAVIRGVEKDFYDIIFRIHAEYQLNKPPLHPFWFTPAQFSGQIIINKAASIVKYFHMSVPNRRLNVDMEWLNGPTEESMEVDIGYIPQMSLTSSSISAPSSDEPGANQNISTIKWNKEIEIQAALDALELHFFPFKEEYIKQGPESNVSNLARICLDNYEFPVQSIIFFPNGSVIHQINANSLLALLNEETDLFSMSVQDPIEKRYLSFLEVGLQKSQNLKIDPKSEL